MASEADRIRGQRWRILGWGSAAALLAAPFAAMQFTGEVNWGPGDFVFAGVVLGIVGLAAELTVRTNRNPAYRGGVALALLGAVLTVWANVAVGIVGSEDQPANLLFFGALLVGLVGAVFARFRTQGMGWAMVATAVSLGLAFAVAMASPTDEPHVPHGRELIGTGVFAALFLASAWLFRRAARDEVSRDRPG